jgi:hypothetical protein
MYLHANSAFASHVWCDGSSGVAHPAVLRSVSVLLCHFDLVRREIVVFQMKALHAASGSGRQDRARGAIGILLINRHVANSTSVAISVITRV